MMYPDYDAARRLVESATQALSYARDRRNPIVERQMSATIAIAELNLAGLACIHGDLLYGSPDPNVCQNESLHPDRDHPHPIDR